MEESPEEVHQELSLLVADMENRCRSNLLRIIRPALDQQSDLDMRFKMLLQRIESHEGKLELTEALRDEVREQRQHVSKMDARIVAIGDQGRAFERDAMNGLTTLKSGQAGLDSRIEEQRAIVNFQRIEQERSNASIQRLQDQLEEANRRTAETVFQTQQRADKGLEELKERVLIQEQRREELLVELFDDPVWRPTGGLPKLGADVAQVAAKLEVMAGQVQQLCKAEDRQTVLEGRIAHLDALSAEDRKTVVDLLGTVDGRLEEAQKRFDGLANGLSAHHAAIMAALKEETCKELAASRAAHDDISNLDAGLKLRCDGLSDKVQSLADRIDSIFKETATDLEELRTQRRRDRMQLEDELKDMRKDVSTTLDKEAAAQGRMEFLAKIVGLVIEINRLGSVMQIQEYADRSKEQWLTTKDELSRQPAESMTAARFVEARRSDGFRSTGRSQAPADVDVRKGLVFDYYLPGPVHFNGQDHERQDVLLLYHQMISKAQVAWEQGPKKVPRRAASSQHFLTGQPGASGGASSGDAPQLKLALSAPTKPSSQHSQASKVPSSTADSGAGGAARSSRQRPGSQGQPQGTGSRGGAATHLATPPGHPSHRGEERVHLPAIRPGQGAIQSARGSAGEFGQLAASRLGKSLGLGKCLSAR